VIDADDVALKVDVAVIAHAVIDEPAPSSAHTVDDGRRTSLDVVDDDHAIERPAFDFTFFVKARISVVLMSTPRLASGWARYNNGEGGISSRGARISEGALSDG
jgi:hypothetical protein